MAVDLNVAIYGSCIQETLAYFLSFSLFLVSGLAIVFGLYMSSISELYIAWFLIPLCHNCHLNQKYNDEVIITGIVNTPVIKPPAIECPVLLPNCVIALSCASPASPQRLVNFFLTFVLSPLHHLIRPQGVTISRSGPTSSFQTCTSLLDPHPRAPLQCKGPPLPS